MLIYTRVCSKILEHICRNSGNPGMGDVEYGKIYDFYLPPAFLRLYDGPSVNVEDMWRILGRGTTNGGLVVGTIIKPKLGLQPKPFW